MSNRFVVAIDKEGCPTCGHDTYYTVIDTVEDSQISSSFGDKEHVEDICKWMNGAFDAGTQEGAGK
jgi:hypothetical protein